MTDLEARDWRLHRDRKTAEPEREAARTRILERYVGLVPAVVSRMALRPGAAADREDLVQSGFIGLLRAFERFDPWRGIEFPYYAWARIRGSVLDGLRELDWVPRSVRRKAAVLRRGEDELRAKSDRAPGAPEMARHLGLDEPAFERLKREGALRVLGSLEQESAAFAPAATWREPEQERLLLEAEERSLMFRGLLRLEVREREVVSQYYLEGRRLKDIARGMGLTESRICQIRSQAVQRLRRAGARYRYEEPALAAA